MKMQTFAYLLIEEKRKFFVVLSSVRNIIHKRDIDEAIPLSAASIEHAITEAAGLGYRIQNAKDPYCK